MSNDLPFTLLSAAPSFPGLLILHFASHTGAIDRREIGSWKGALLLLVGLILIALPWVIWNGLFVQQYPTGTHHAPPLEVLFLAGFLVVLFLWFLSIVNAFTFQFPAPTGNPWEEHWGATYSPELKQRLLGSVMEQLDRAGKIGRLVVDVGSGAAPVSQILPPLPGRRYILIDIAGQNAATSESQCLRLDAEVVMRPGSLSFGKAYIRVCRFLGRAPRASLPEQPATAMLFSDILNYVDFRGVLRGFARFLQTGGRIIIVNLPTRGIRAQFSEKGLRNNDDLCLFLAEQYFEIESKDFPCRPPDESDESVEMIVLVARKTAHSPGQSDRTS